MGRDIVSRRHGDLALARAEGDRCRAVAASASGGLPTARIIGRQLLDYDEA